MPQKINIIKLTKPNEYLKKELDAVTALKFKMLRDCDWTQAIDSPLTVGSLLRWRIWRHSVYVTTITPETLASAMDELNQLDSNKPLSVSTLHSQLVSTQFNFKTIDGFKQSCLEVIKEVFGGTIDADIAQKIAACTDIVTATDVLLKYIDEHTE